MIRLLCIATTKAAGYINTVRSKNIELHANMGIENLREHQDLCH